MFRILICAFFLGILGCAAAPQNMPASSPAPQARTYGQADGACTNEEEFKLCILIARAQAQSAEELADCIIMKSYSLDQRMQKSGVYK
ncbi:MAG: hypothetical protein WCW31_03095 [Patescibacteria group bacterium]